MLHPSAQVSFFKARSTKKDICFGLGRGVGVHITGTSLEKNPVDIFGEKKLGGGFTSENLPLLRTRPSQKRNKETQQPGATANTAFQKRNKEKQQPGATANTGFPKVAKDRNLAGSNPKANPDQLNSGAQWKTTRLEA